ncbi:MAG: hypothetical protein V4678_00195 [Patescibacteria group bacterium]
MRQPKGFSIVEGLILVGVLVLLVGVGYVGWKAFAESDPDSQATSVTTKQSAQVITTKADLEAAEKALDELNFEDESAAQAESQASL